MKESSTYQAILEEGRIEKMKEILITLGEHKGFDEPSSHSRKMINSINDFERLEQLTLRLLDVNTWDDLFAL